MITIPEVVIYALEIMAGLTTLAAIVICVWAYRVKKEREG